MPSNAISGVGTLFQRSDGSSANGTFRTIAEINTVSGPNLSRDTIDVTSLDSTGGYKEFIAGFRDGGEVSLEMNFTIDGYGQMKLDFEDDALVDYKVILPDTTATTFSFSGLVTAMGLSIPMNDKITCSVTIKVSGQVDVQS